MKSLFMLIVFLFTFIDVLSQPCGALKVTYEGKIYNTVQIGNQCWLKENLNVGTKINGSKDALDNDKIEKYCYADRESNCETYGGLYQWNEAMGYSQTEGAQGICPTGWHLPTLTEFELLKDEVHEDGNSLKAIGHGKGNRGGTNRSGFSALMSGVRSYYREFLHLESYTRFWSSTEYNINNAYTLYPYDNDSTIYLDYYYMEVGFSVRCVKD